MRLSVRRVLAISAIGLVVFVAAAALVLHTNPVQSRILAWSIEELERRFDLVLAADDLQYNLLRRRVTMINVRLAARNLADRPFFAARRITVQLPWAVYRGRLYYEDIEIDNGEVLIHRDRAGTSNLPTARKPRDPSAPPRRVDARALTVRDLDFTYRDEQRDIEVLAPQVRADLEYAAGEGATGPFAIGSDLVVRFGDRRVIVAPVNGTVTYDGSNLELGNVQLKTVEGSLAVNGSIARVLDQPALDLTLDGTIDIERSASWAPAPVRVAGTATLEGTMKGAPSQFVLETRLSTDQAEVGEERNVRLDALSRLTPGSLTVSKAIIHPAAGGEVVAAAEVPLGSQEPWWLTANYSGVAAATAFRLAEVEPLPFGATLRGAARLDGRPGEPFRLLVNNTSSPTMSSATAPLRGDIEFAVDGDRWRARQQHQIGATAVSGTMGGVWNRRAVTRSTFDGRLNVRTSDVSDAARTAALFGFSAPAVVRNTRGPMDALVDLSGEFTSPRLAGTATTPGVEIPSIGQAAVTAAFDVSERAISITDIAGRMGTAQISGEYVANLETRQLGGSLTVEAPSAGDVLTGVPESLRVEGPVSAAATIGGTVDLPEIVATITGRGLTVGEQPVEALDGKVRWIADEVLVDELKLTQGAGILTASGRYGLETRNYSVELQGQDVEWTGSSAQLGNTKALLDVKFAGTGSVDRPRGEGIVEFDLSGGFAGALIGRGTATVRLDGTHALVTAKVPTLGAALDGKIALHGPFVYDAILIADKLDLEQVVRLAGLREGYVEGTASLNATASGTLREPVSSRVFVNLQEIAAAVEGVTVKLASPSRFTWEQSALTVDTLDLGIGETGRLQASGRLAPGNVANASFDASFKGEVGDLVRIGRPFGVPPALEASGPVSIVMRSTGGLEQSTATLELAGGLVRWDTLPTVEDVAISAAFDGATFDVSRLSGHWQGGMIEGSASIPRGVLVESAGAAPVARQQGFAKLRVVGLNEQAFAPWVSRSTLASIGAHISATLDATITRASLEGLAGRVTFDEANFIVAGVPVAQVRPSVLGIDGGLVRAEDVVWSFGGFAAATVPGGPQTGVPGGGELTLTGTARFLPAEKAALDFQIKGDADLRVLSALAPTVAFDGVAKVNVGVGGSPSSPVYNGRVDVANAEVLIREPRVVLGDLEGTIAFDGQRVLLDNFGGTANGGALLLEGGFLIGGDEGTRGALTLQVQGAALEYPDGLQSESDALLIFRPDERGGWNLTGDVIVTRSVFNEPISIAALAAARRTRAPSAGTNDRLDQLHLNVFVTTREDLRVDNNYARLEAGGAIRIVGTVDEPVLGGQITLREGGEVYLAGRTFHVAHGSISFTSPTRMEPEFDVELQTRVAGDDITLTLSGPLERLQTDVRSSNPETDSREAMAAIFGNLTGEDAVTLLSAELLGATGRAIGLDTLRVERGFEVDEFRTDPGLIATETDPSTRLTISKRLRPDVELTLSQSLRESGALTAVVSYRPKRNIELRAISRDNVDRAVALRHEITFGGTAAATTERPPQPRVSALTFSGDSNLPEAELREMLRLDVDDAFDFYTWQRDLDELREYYQDQNYYEVRIRGNREPAPDGETVALNYEIVPGPRAELVIVGHELEVELEEELRDSWRRSIFDRFLIEDIEARVRRHLLSEDYVGSLVEAEVTESTPARKQVRVRVETGARVASRTVRYTGNTAFDAGDLDRLIEQRGLDVDGWLEPARIADAIESHYRDSGFLQAEVTAAAAEVSGQVAALPVTIEEGSRYSIETMFFAGVHPDRQVEVARAAGLEFGMPFVATDLDAARRRVQDYYARRGFNAAEITLDPIPRESEPAVDLTFTVSEGPQQILREVATQGATRTDEGVLTRTLRLAPGDPVNLAAWSQARKRLYDTNVFRQVDIEPVPIEPTAEDKAANIQPVRAVVRLVEYPVWRLRYGLQLNDEKTSTPGDPIEERSQSLGVLTDLRNQNLFGRAITAGIAARVERDRRSESLFLSNASLFGLPLRSNAFVFDSRQRFRFDGEVNSITDRRGASVEQRWRPSLRSEVTYGYRFERNHTFFPGRPDEFVIVNAAKVTASAFIDRRDEPFEPTRGWFSSINWDQAVVAFGSDYPNAKLLLQQLYFRSIGKLVLASRVQVGTEFSALELLPSERFLLGGATTVRGYAENSLGELDVFGIGGGDSMLLLNQEARFPVRGWVQGVVFVDAGNVFPVGENLSLSNLKVGYGVGLRLASPFAMLRADFGIPGSPARPGELKPKGRWYIGIGHIF